jgi:hypothetical protein
MRDSVKLFARERKIRILHKKERERDGFQTPVPADFSASTPSKRESETDFVVQQTLSPMLRSCLTRKYDSHEGNLPFSSSVESCTCIWKHLKKRESLLHRHKCQIHNNNISRPKRLPNLCEESFLRSSLSSFAPSSVCHHEEVEFSEEETNTDRRSLSRSTGWWYYFRPEDESCKCDNDRKSHEYSSFYENGRRRDPVWPSTPI